MSLQFSRLSNIMFHKKNKLKSQKVKKNVSEAIFKYIKKKNKMENYLNILVFSLNFVKSDIDKVNFNFIKVPLQIEIRYKYSKK